jgi:lysylphosphatidylglycerol synthetase-like protein (DUF2156 family)
MNFWLSLFGFPGLAGTLLLGVLIALASGMRPRRVQGSTATDTNRLERAIALLCLLIIGLAPGLLPGPFGPQTLSPICLLLIWSAIEGAALLPLLPGLTSRTSPAVRAASRAAQVGVAGRAAIWLAAGIGMAAEPTMAALPSRLLALFGGLLALSAAAGLGPFGPERSLVPDGSDERLDGWARALLPLTRIITAAALLLVLLATTLPPALLEAPLAAGLTVLLALVFGLLLRQTAAIPRLTLPAALHWCWWRAFPLALAGLAYLLLV